jgi:hypothetical protein
MLDNLFQILCYIVISILALTTGNSIYRISAKGTRMAGVTGQQRMLTPTQHLIVPLVFPGVRVSLILTMDYFIYLIWTLILTADFSVYLAVLTDFDCGLFRSPNLDTLNSNTDI